MESESSSPGLQKTLTFKMTFNIKFHPEISNSLCLELITVPFFNAVSIVFYS